MESIELRKARMLVFFDKYWAAFMAFAFLAIGLLLGGYAQSYYSRVERMALMQRNDEAVRDMRLQCRRTVDERDGKVQEATTAATEAVRAATRAIEAAADDAPAPAAPVKPPAKPRAAPPDINALVREANRKIEEAR